MAPRRNRPNVILSLITFLLILYAAAIINPTAIGPTNLKPSWDRFIPSINWLRKDKAVIIINTGKAHITIVNTANLGPPILCPIATILWVLLGPGKIPVKAISSTNSSSVRYFFLITI